MLGSPIRRQVKRHRHSCGKCSCSLFSTPRGNGWDHIFTFDIRLLKIRIRKQSRIPPRVDLGSCLLGCLILLADAIAPKTAVRNKSINSSNSSSRSKRSSGQGDRAVPLGATARATKILRALHRSARLPNRSRGEQTSPSPRW